MTTKQLWHALITNFEDEDGFRIQQMLIHDAPKFGNDIDYVDNLTRDAYQVYIDEIAHYHNTRYGRGPIGGGYFPGTSSISANVPQGAQLCATRMEERKASLPGRVLTVPRRGCSRTYSRIQVCLQAAHTQIERRRASEPEACANGFGAGEGCSETDSYVEHIDDLKGYHVQYNVVSRDVLLDAQKHPESTGI